MIYNIVIFTWKYFYVLSEVISYLLTVHDTMHQQICSSILGLNMIRGFFIFMVFICKPKIWTLAQNRHPKLWRFFGFFKFSTCCEYQGGNTIEENSRLSVKFVPSRGGNSVILPLHTKSEGGEPDNMLRLESRNGLRTSRLSRSTNLSELSTRI